MKILLLIFTAESIAIAQQTAENAIDVDTVAQTAVVDTSTHIAVADSSIHTDTSTTSTHNTVVAADTLIYHTAVDTLITTADAVPPARVAADSSVRSDAPDTLFPPVKEPFRLPGYTFHVVFLLASAAVIAAALRFLLLLRRRGDSRRFLTTTRLSVLDKSVQRGCRHIEANYGDPALTPEAVCRSLVTGKACLDALFMNELGINVQDFIIQVRVNAIKNRIASTTSPDINGICAECGFADRAEAERHFSTVCGGVGLMDYARENRGII